MTEHEFDEFGKVSARLTLWLEITSPGLSGNQGLGTPVVLDLIRFVLFACGCNGPLPQLRFGTDAMSMVRFLGPLVACGASWRRRVDLGVPINCTDRLLGPGCLPGTLSARLRLCLGQAARSGPCRRRARAV